MLTVFPRISALGLFEWFIRRVCVCGLGGGGGAGAGEGEGEQLITKYFFEDFLNSKCS